MMDRTFLKNTAAIAIPCALQAMLQTSFSFIDQMMVGQLGESVIAGIGISGKFAGIFTSLASVGLSGACAVMVSQFLAQKKHDRASQRYWQILLVSVLTGIGFFLLCLFGSGAITSMYSTDPTVLAPASLYLRVYAFSFPAVAVSVISAVWLRCTSRAGLVTVSAFVGAIANTILNYLFIFVLPAFRGMECAGAALASVLSQWLMAAMNVGFIYFSAKDKDIQIPEMVRIQKLFQDWMPFLVIAIPLTVGEVLWSISENFYSMVYGKLSTVGLAAMTMTNPIQGAFFGILSGFGQAASILIAARLGEKAYDKARQESGWMCLLAFYFSLSMAALVIVLAPLYVSIYNVDEQVRQTTITLLWAFAFFSLVKVQNMVLAGGVLRSGGLTKITLLIDTIGTWGFGVPLAYLAGVVLRLDIVWVYSILSCEEIVRYLIGLWFYKKGLWMKTLSE